MLTGGNFWVLIDNSVSKETDSRSIGYGTPQCQDQKAPKIREKKLKNLSSSTNF